MDIKSSDFILILNLEDIHGQKMRVADTAEFTVRVWTNDPTHFLTFNRRDIISDDYNDRIAIDRMQMECLASGTIIYDYDYARWNADFSATNEKYNKVKTVVTDVYWRNVLNPGNPCNVINYQTIEHIYDLIEKERVEREKLGYYIENEYTNKLADEVKRSTDVDIEMYKTIKENKEGCDSRTTEITTKLDDEIKRSTDADNAMLAKINDNLSSTTEITSDLTGKLNDEIVRAKAKENEIANDLASEIERSNNFKQQIRDSVDQETSRATAKETLIDGKITDEIARAKVVESDITSSLQRLKTSVKTKDDAHDEAINTIDTRLTAEVSRATAKDNATDNRLSVIEGDSTVIGSIAHSLADAKHYTDDEIAKVKSDLDVSGFATKSEIAEVKSTISTKADKATTYTKTEVDEKIANFDGNVQLDDYAKTVDVDEKIETVKTNTATELGKKLDKTTYATDKLTFANKTETNNAIKTVSDNLTAEVSRATEAENKIKTDLTAEINNKVATVTIEKDSTNDLQYHLMVDGEKSGEINIPKDQFLSNVVYSSATKVITFTFETTTGTTTTDVNISDLIDTYTAGDGLTLADNKFSVKKDATSQAYIEVSASGVKVVGIDEALALKADKTDVNTSLDAKLDKSTYTTDKTNINNTIKTVSDNLAAEVTRATEAENGIKAEVALKANSSDVYTTSQVDEKVNVKANSADVNTSLDNKLDKTIYETDKATYALKSDVTTELNKKANSSDVYTTSQVDEKLNAKANSADVYTKEQCDNSFMKMWQGSQSEYDAIAPKDNNTLYIIL